MQFDDRLRDHVKSTVDMAKALEIIGWELPNRQHKILSIYNSGELTPSLHVYRDSFYDYSTGQGGDPIKFVMDALRVPFGEALKILGRGAPVSGRKVCRTPREEKVLDLTETFEGYDEATEESRQWATELVEEKWPFLSVDDIEGFGVHIGPTAMYVPHYDDAGIVRGVKIRALPGGAKYSARGSSYTARLYRAVELPDDTEIVLLCEGESDTWCLTKHCANKPGVGVLGLPSGSALWRNHWDRDLGPERSVMLLLDDDRAGNEAAARIKEPVPHSKQIKVPGGRVAEAMPTVDDWLG